MLVAVLGASADDPGPRPGQIIVDPDDARWLRRSGGGSFFMCGPGDPEGFLYRGAERPDGTRAGDQEQLIRRLDGTGANCIYMIAVRSHGGDGGPTEDPFIQHDPALGADPKVLDQWDRWLGTMDRAGIVAFFILYDDSASVWDTGDEVAAPERELIRRIVGRLKEHTHLIWCVAEEYGEALSPERVRRIAAEIRAADDRGHPIAVHKNSGLGFEEFADDPSIDQFAVQYNVPTAEELHDGLVEADKASAGRYNLNLAEAADWGTGTEARRKCWACAMAGAYVMILGMDIEHTQPSDLEDCGRLVRFMEGVDLRGVAAHDELAAGDAQYVLARPGAVYIAYSSHAAGSLGLRGVPAGDYTLSWLDCATGRTEKAARTVEGGELSTWPVPDGMGPELALLVQARDPRVTPLRTAP